MIKEEFRPLAEFFFFFGMHMDSNSAKNASEKFFIFFKKSVDKRKSVCYNTKAVDKDSRKWKHSSVGRASALQAEGHRFEPYCFHHALLKQSASYPIGYEMAR